MVAERRRLAFIGVGPRPLDAFDRIVGHRVTVTEILIQRSGTGWQHYRRSTAVKTSGGPELASLSAFCAESGVYIKRKP
jgi:hypothetical protein